MSLSQRRIDLVKEVLSLPTAPFCEQHVIAWLKQFAEDRNLSMRQDKWGNMLVHYQRGRRAKRPLALCAHLDHPGFEALRRTKDGEIEARWFGRRVPTHCFPGATVRFFSEGKWTRCKVARLPSRENDLKPFSLLLKCPRPVAPGSPGMWDFPNPRIRGNRIYARAHDDLAAVAAIVCVLDEAVRRRVNGDLYAFFTRGEEAGLIGVTGACKSRTLPRKCVAVALEASRALPDAPLGGGVVVRVGDLSTVFTPWVTQILRQTAHKLAKKDDRFKFQRRLMDGGTCEATAYSAFGYDTGGLCLPLGNYHNLDRERNRIGAEYIALSDFECMVKLLEALLRRGDMQPASNVGFDAYPLEEQFRQLSGELTRRR